MIALAGWESSYVIVGTSADALIGLQVVVITLIARRRIVAVQASSMAWTRSWRTPHNIRLVTNPRKMGLRETERAFVFFSLHGLTLDSVIVNRLLPHEVSNVWFSEWHTSQDCRRLKNTLLRFQ